MGYMPPRGYRHLSIREEVYRKLEEFAKSKGLAYPTDAIPLLLEYADIYSKLEYLLQVRVKDLLQTGAVTNTASKAVATDKATGTANSSTQVGEGYEWCRSKAKIRNLQNFLKWVDDSFGLIDWWEEDDKVCFETRRKPAKID